MSPPCVGIRACLCVDTIYTNEQWPWWPPPPRGDSARGDDVGSVVQRWPRRYCLWYIPSIPVPRAEKGKAFVVYSPRTGCRASRLAMHLSMFVRALRRTSTSGRFASPSTAVAAATASAKLARFAWVRHSDKQCVFPASVTPCGAAPPFFAVLKYVHRYHFLVVLRSSDRETRPVASYFSGKYRYTRAVCVRPGRVEKFDITQQPCTR